MFILLVIRTTVLLGAIDLPSWIGVSSEKQESLRSGQKSKLLIMCVVGDTVLS